MKKFLVGFLGLSTVLTAVAYAAAISPVLTSDQVNLLNNHSGTVNRQLQLGTVLSSYETAINLTQNLANGKIFVGNGSGVATAVTPTGDVTITNAGVTAIGANKVLESMIVDTATAGLSVDRIAHAVWDPSGVSGQRTVGGHGLSVTLPAKSIVTQAWFYTKTSVVSTGNNGTIAFSCTGANDLFSAADIDSSSGVAGQIGAGVPVGTAATMVFNTAACEITATVAVNAFTAGKIDFYVRYVVAE